MLKIPPRYYKQNGFVSIIVAAVLMVLLSLVTIGFSRVMQREQRQALDRQLSTQAFYAAETGVNDVYNAILDEAPIPIEKTTCDVTSWPIGVGGGRVDPDDDLISYTCLQYDQTPTDLVFTDSVTTEISKIFPIQPAAIGDTVTSVTFSWNGENGGTGIDAASDNCTASKFLPPSFSARSIPLLRLDLIAAPTAGFNRDYLIENTSNLYLYPKNCGTNTVAFGGYIGNNTGQVVDVRCNNPAGSGCTITVTGLTQDRYFARVRSVYTNVGTLTVSATSNSGSFEFQGAQTKVDSTGKANDVLRRIEVRLANSPDNRVPEGVIEAVNGVCKTIAIAPGSPPLVRTRNPYNITGPCN